MRIKEGLRLDFKDVLIVPQRSDLDSRKSVELVREFKFKHSSYTLKCIPIIASNMSTIGTFKMADVLGKNKMLTALSKYYSIDDLFEFFKVEERQDHCFYTIGIEDNSWRNLFLLREKFSDFHFPKMICFDVANCMTEIAVNFLKKVRNLCPKSIIMAGNVVGANMAEHLILNGADIVKIGIGSGSACLTRVKTGVGYPQLSAIDESAYAAHGLGGHVCSDGGCNRVGDICKAFAAGGDFVMLGGFLAGHKECEGRWIDRYGIEYEEGGYNEDDYGRAICHEFYGMSSKMAQEKYNGGMKRYRAEEGKTVLVEYKGEVENTISDINGGISSCCSYVGAKNLKNLPKCASFVRCTQQENTIFNNI